jgi:hypothetical protein
MLLKLLIICVLVVVTVGIHAVGFSMLIRAVWGLREEEEGSCPTNLADRRVEMSCRDGGV